MQCAAEADLLLSIGTSLQVYPIAGALPAAKNAGARVVIVNAEPTPFDGIADAVLRDSIGETLPRIVGLAVGVPCHLRASGAQCAPVWGVRENTRTLFPPSFRLD